MEVWLRKVFDAMKQEQDADYSEYLKRRWPNQYGEWWDDYGKDLPDDERQESWENYLDGVWQAMEYDGE
jgi:hypothetical protein